MQRDVDEVGGIDRGELGPARGDQHAVAARMLRLPAEPGTMPLSPIDPRTLDEGGAWRGRVVERRHLPSVGPECSRTSANAWSVRVSASSIVASSWAV